MDSSPSEPLFSIQSLSDGILPVLCPFSSFSVDSFISMAWFISFCLIFLSQSIISSPEFFSECYSYGYSCINDTSVWTLELCQSYLKVNMFKLVLLIFQAFSNHAPISQSLNSTTVFLILYKTSLILPFASSRLVLAPSTSMTRFYQFHFLKVP